MQPQQPRTASEGASSTRSTTLHSYVGITWDSIQCSPTESDDLTYYAKTKYQGFDIPEPGWTLPRRKVSEVTPQQFFDDYVVPRKPVVLDTQGAEEPLPGLRGRKWTYEYLKHEAGDLPARVETRNSGEESYGKGKTKIMKFGDFIEELRQGNTNLYMTTQPLPEDEDGPTALMTTPLTKLKQDFLCRPDILGNLVPFQYNTWIGRTGDKPTSSGLHHDFHDNIYVLLSGRKHFRLLSPAAAQSLETSGGATAVLPNGVINHEFPTRLDGAHPTSVAESNLERTNRVAMSNYENNFTNNTERTKAAIQQAFESIQRYNDAYARALLEKAETQVQVFDLVRDCQENSADPLQAISCLSESNLNSTIEDDNVLTGKKRRRSPLEDAGNDFLAERSTHQDDEQDLTEDGNDGSAESDTDADLEDALRKFEEGNPEEDYNEDAQDVLDDYENDNKTQRASKTSKPSNFCNVELDAASLKAGRFRGHNIAYCDISAGDLLYLPAGWFHEVISTSSDSNATKNDVLPGSHMAFNYWVHPPSSNQYEKPYGDDYWLKRFVDIAPADNT